jgi:hypothetical protein
MAFQEPLCDAKVYYMELHDAQTAGQGPAVLCTADIFVNERCEYGSFPRNVGLSRSMQGIQGIFLNVPDYAKVMYQNACTNECLGLSQGQP